MTCNLHNQPAPFAVTSLFLCWCHVCDM